MREMLSEASADTGAPPTDDQDLRSLDGYD